MERLRIIQSLQHKLESAREVTSEPAKKPADVFNHGQVSLLKTAQFKAPGDLTWFKEGSEAKKLVETYPKKTNEVIRDVPHDGNCWIAAANYVFLSHFRDHPEFRKTTISRLEKQDPKPKTYLKLLKDLNNYLKEGGKLSDDELMLWMSIPNHQKIINEFTNLVTKTKPESYHGSDKIGVFANVVGIKIGHDELGTGHTEGMKTMQTGVDAGKQVSKRLVYVQESMREGQSIGHYVVVEPKIESLQEKTVSKLIEKARVQQTSSIDELEQKIQTLESFDEYQDVHRQLIEALRIARGDEEKTRIEGVLGGFRQKLEQFKGQKPIVKLEELMKGIEDYRKQLQDPNYKPNPEELKRKKELMEFNLKQLESDENVSTEERERIRNDFLKLYFEINKKRRNIFRTVIALSKINSYLKNYRTEKLVKEIGVKKEENKQLREKINSNWRLLHEKEDELRDAGNQYVVKQKSKKKSKNLAKYKKKAQEIESEIRLLISKYEEMLQKAAEQARDQINRIMDYNSRPQKKLDFSEYEREIEKHLKLEKDRFNAMVRLLKNRFIKANEIIQDFEKKDLKTKVLAEQIPEIIITPPKLENVDELSEGLPSNKPPTIAIEEQEFQTVLEKDKKQNWQVGMPMVNVAASQSAEKPENESLSPPIVHPQTTAIEEQRFWDQLATQFAESEEHLKLIEEEATARAKRIEEFNQIKANEAVGKAALAEQEFHGILKELDRLFVAREYDQVQKLLENSEKKFPRDSKQYADILKLKSEFQPVLEQAKKQNWQVGMPMVNVVASQPAEKPQDVSKTAEDKISIKNYKPAKEPLPPVIVRPQAKKEANELEGLAQLFEEPSSDKPKHPTSKKPTSDITVTEPIKKRRELGGGSAFKGKEPDEPVSSLEPEIQQSIFIGSVKKAIESGNLTEATRLLSDADKFQIQISKEQREGLETLISQLSDEASKAELDRKIDDFFKKHVEKKKEKNSDPDLRPVLEKPPNAVRPTEKSQPKTSSVNAWGKPLKLEQSPVPVVESKVQPEPIGETNEEKLRRLNEKAIQIAQKNARIAQAIQIAEEDARIAKETASQIIVTKPTESTMLPAMTPQLSDEASKQVVAANIISRAVKDYLARKKMADLLKSKPTQETSSDILKSSEEAKPQATVTYHERIPIESVKEEFEEEVEEENVNPNLLPPDHIGSLAQTDTQIAALVSKKLDTTLYGQVKTEFFKLCDKKPGGIRRINISPERGKELADKTFTAKTIKKSVKSVKLSQLVILEGLSIEGNTYLNSLTPENQLKFLQEFAYPYWCCLKKVSPVETDLWLTEEKITKLSSLMRSGNPTPQEEDAVVKKHQANSFTERTAKLAAGLGQALLRTQPGDKEVSDALEELFKTYIGCTLPQLKSDSSVSAPSGVERQIIITGRKSVSKFVVPRLLYQVYQQSKEKKKLLEPLQNRLQKKYKNLGTIPEPSASPHVKAAEPVHSKLSESLLGEKGKTTAANYKEELEKLWSENGPGFSIDVLESAASACAAGNLNPEFLDDFEDGGLVVMRDYLYPYILCQQRLAKGDDPRSTKFFSNPASAEDLLRVMPAQDEEERAAEALLTKNPSLENVKDEGLIKRIKAAQIRVRERQKRQSKLLVRAIELSNRSMAPEKDSTGRIIRAGGLGKSPISVEQCRIFKKMREGGVEHAEAGAGKSKSVAMYPELFDLDCKILHVSPFPSISESDRVETCTITGLQRKLEAGEELSQYMMVLDEYDSSYYNGIQETLLDQGIRYFEMSATRNSGGLDQVIKRNQEKLKLLKGLKEKELSLPEHLKQYRYKSDGQWIVAQDQSSLFTQAAQKAKVGQETVVELPDGSDDGTTQKLDDFQGLIGDNKSISGAVLIRYTNPDGDIVYKLREKGDWKDLKESGLENALQNTRPTVFSLYTKVGKYSAKIKEYEVNLQKLEDRKKVQIDRIEPKKFVTNSKIDAAMNKAIELGQQEHCKGKSILVEFPHEGDADGIFQEFSRKLSNRTDVAILYRNNKGNLCHLMLNPETEKWEEKEEFDKLKPAPTTYCLYTKDCRGGDFREHSNERVAAQVVFFSKTPSEDELYQYLRRNRQEIFSNTEVWAFVSENITLEDFKLESKKLQKKLDQKGIKTRAKKKLFNEIKKQFENLLGKQLPPEFSLNMKEILEHPENIGERFEEAKRLLLDIQIREIAPMLAKLGEASWVAEEKPEAGKKEVTLIKAPVRGQHEQKDMLRDLIQFNQTTVHPEEWDSVAQGSEERAKELSRLQKKISEIQDRIASSPKVIKEIKRKAQNLEKSKLELETELKKEKEQVQKDEREKAALEKKEKLINEYLNLKEKRREIALKLIEDWERYKPEITTVAGLMEDKKYKEISDNVDQKQTDIVLEIKVKKEKLEASKRKTGSIQLELERVVGQIDTLRKQVQEETTKNSSNTLALPEMEKSLKQMKSQNKEIDTILDRTLDSGQDLKAKNSFIDLMKCIKRNYEALRNQNEFAERNRAKKFEWNDRIKSYFERLDRKEPLPEIRAPDSYPIPSTPRTGGRKPKTPRSGKQGTVL